jgi:hypothetical protein
MLVEAIVSSKDSSRWPYASTCNHEIITVAHPADSLNNLVFIVCNNLDPLQSLSSCQTSAQQGF